MLTTTAVLAIVPAMLGAPRGPVTATFTADNHYAIYTATGGVVSLVGGNETGAPGSPGTYNWSVAETFTFTPGDTFYVAAWSDAGLSQGLLGEIDLGGLMLRTGDPLWQVYRTGINLGDGSAWPAASQVAAWAAAADEGLAWAAPYVGPKNTGSVDPWGKINGIGTHAEWIWAEGGGTGDPLNGSGNADQALLFRAVLVPAPGSAVCLAAAAAVLAAGRRRGGTARLSPSSPPATPAVPASSVATRPEALLPA